MEQLKERIKKARKITTSTLNVYLRNMRILSKAITGTDFKDTSFLNNIKKVKTEIEKKRLPTQKTYLATIIVVLMLDGDKSKNIVKKYRDYLSEIKGQYDKQMETQRKTRKESENWLSKTELNGVIDYYRKKVYKYKLNSGSKQSLNKKEKDILQKYLIAGLYILMPPRRNVYANMRVINHKKFGDLDEDEKVDNNYLVIHNNSKKYFIFNDYKTKKKYGTQKIRIEPDLNKVINTWYRHSKNQEWLIVNGHGNRVPSNVLSRMIQQTFKKATGKSKISSTLLRHMFVSDKFKDLDTFKKLQDDAEKMGHDIITQIKTYKKVED